MRLEEAGHRPSREPSLRDTARSRVQMLTFRRVRVKAKRPSGARAGSMAPSPAGAITEGATLLDTGTRQRRVLSISPAATIISRPSAVHAGLSVKRFHAVRGRGSADAG